MNRVSASAGEGSGQGQQASSSAPSPRAALRQADACVPAARSRSHAGLRIATLARPRARKCTIPGAPGKPGRAKAPFRCTDSPFRPFGGRRTFSPRKHRQRPAQHRRSVARRAATPRDATQSTTQRYARHSVSTLSLCGRLAPAPHGALSRPRMAAPYGLGHKATLSHCAAGQRRCQTTAPAPTLRDGLRPCGLRRHATPHTHQRHSEQAATAAGRLAPTPRGSLSLPRMAALAALACRRLDTAPPHQHRCTRAPRTAPPRPRRLAPAPRGVLAHARMAALALLACPHGRRRRPARRNAPAPRRRRTDTNAAARPTRHRATASTDPAPRPAERRC